MLRNLFHSCYFEQMKRANCDGVWTKADIHCCLSRISGSKCLIGFVEYSNPTLSYYSGYHWLYPQWTWMRQVWLIITIGLRFWMNCRLQKQDENKINSWKKSLSWRLFRILLTGEHILFLFYILTFMVQNLCYKNEIKHFNFLDIEMTNRSASTILAWFFKLIFSRR